MIDDKLGWIKRNAECIDVESYIYALVANPLEQQLNARLMDMGRGNSPLRILR